MYPHKGAFPSMGGGRPNLDLAAVVGEAQWMSQSAYQNIDLEKVDWAHLAQQWIHMKESCGGAPDEPEIQIEAPPPPRFSQPIPEYEEKGEAPMEVEHDDEPSSSSSSAGAAAAVTAPPAPTNIFQTNNWNSESNQSRGQHQKPWNRKGNRWNNMSSNHSKSQRNSGDAYVSGQVYNNNNNSAKHSASSQIPVWSGGSTSKASPFANTNSSHPSDLRLQGLDAKSGIQLEHVGNLTATPSLDAAQRKTLPAWIREGLEKMEREKQRQVERDREMKERDEIRRQEKLIEQNLLMQLNPNESSPKLPAKSKFESDTESDNDDVVNSDHSENIRGTVGSSSTATTMTSAANANDSASKNPASTQPVPTTFKPHRTKAEILTEIMLSVRKNLTEILLEVTNEEISAIAQDTLSKVRIKGRKAQSVQKNALTAIAPSLGLVGYYDSDASKSENESDTDDEKNAEEQRASDVDSESELMRAIEQRKAAFENKSIEIESYLAEIEEKEKQWLEQDDGVKTEDTDSPSCDSPAPSSGNQSRLNENDETQRDIHKAPIVSRTERKGSRFSDAKTLMYNVANSQLVNSTPQLQQQPPLPTPIVRQSSLEQRPVAATDTKKSKHSRRDEHSDDSDSSRKRSKYSSSASRSSHHRSKHERYSRSPSSRAHHHKRSRRRSSSSSSDRSSTYSRHSDRSHKHSRRRERSSSRSSYGSHKHDKHSRSSKQSRH